MISIVIPVYNAEKSLDRCLSSISNQTFDDFEAIVVDDGSKDNSKLIAQKWSQADSRFVLVSQENRGVSAARNAGIKCSKGEALCFVDADDYVDDNFLEKLYSAFHKESLTVCNFVYNDDLRNVLCFAGLEQIISFDQDFIRNYLMDEKIAFAIWNKMFDNNLLHEAEVYFPQDISVGEDMIFVLTYLSKIKSIYYVDDCLYHYCVGYESAMRSPRDYLSVYEKTLHYLKNNRFGNVKIEDRTLNLWARKVFAFVLTSSYVSQMSCLTFKRYFAQLNNSVLLSCVKKAPFINDFKKNMITLAARLKSSFLLYAIIKANAYRHGIK